MKIFEIIENETSVCYGKTGHGKRATFQFVYGWKKNCPPPIVKFLHAHKTCFATVYKNLTISISVFRIQQFVGNCEIPEIVITIYKYGTHPMVAFSIR